MTSVFLEQWHLFFPKVSAVWRHFLIFLHARVPISRLSFYSPFSPFLLFTPVTLSPPSPFPYHPASLYLIIFLSLFLSLRFPFLSWEASRNLPFADALHTNLSFLSPTRLLYIIPQKHWSAIHDQNLSRSAWGIWSFSDSYRIQNALPLRYYFTVHVELQNVHRNKPQHVLLSLYTGGLMFSGNHRENLYLWVPLISSSKQLFILIYRGRLRLVVTFYAT